MKLDDNNPMYIFVMCIFFGEGKYKNEERKNYSRRWLLEVSSFSFISSLFAVLLSSLSFRSIKYCWQWSPLTSISTYMWPDHYYSYCSYMSCLFYDLQNVQSCFSNSVIILNYTSLSLCAHSIVNIFLLYFRGKLIKT